LNRQAPSGREVDMERMLDLHGKVRDGQMSASAKTLQPDMVVALGSGYQRLFIIPSLKA
jgi:hypothetical protein